MVVKGRIGTTQSTRTGGVRLQTNKPTDMARTPTAKNRRSFDFTTNYQLDTVAGYPFQDGILSQQDIAIARNIQEPMATDIEGDDLLLAGLAAFDCLINGTSN